MHAGAHVCVYTYIHMRWMFHEQLVCPAGPNCHALFTLEDMPESLELTNKLVFCFSPAAYWNNLCLDLAPSNKYDGHVVAAHCQTYSIKVPDFLMQCCCFSVSHKVALKRFLSLSHEALGNWYVLVSASGSVCGIVILKLFFLPQASSWSQMSTLLTSLLYLCKAFVKALLITHSFIYMSSVPICTLC